MEEIEKKRIVCLGSATIDVTVRSSSFNTSNIKGKEYTVIEQGTKHNAQDIILHNGGSASNMAVILSKLGRKTAVISRVGDDVYGDIVIKHLNDIGVDATYVKRTIGTRTGTTINLSLPGGEKTLLVHRGALDHVNPQDVPETFVKHSGGCIITSMTSITAANAALKTARVCKENDNYLALAPSISMIREKSHLILNIIKQVDTLILNENEIIELTKEKNLKKAMIKVNKLGAKKIVVLRGTAGSIVYYNGEYTEHKAYRVKVADTTGAGDAYSAGFIFSELEGKPIKECMDFGAKISAMVITKPGAQEGIPTPYQLKHFKARLI